MKYILALTNGVTINGTDKTAKPTPYVVNDEVVSSFLIHHQCSRYE